MSDVQFPEYSVTLALGEGVWRCQFTADREPLIVRRAVNAPASSRGLAGVPKGGDRDALHLDTRIEWSRTRGPAPAALGAVLTAARSIMDARGWPTRLSTAF